MQSRSSLVSRPGSKSAALIVITSLLASLYLPLGTRSVKAALKESRIARTSSSLPVPMMTPLPTPPPVPTPATPPPGQPPGANLPNLDVRRTLQSTVPAISPSPQLQLFGLRPICEGGDYDCGGGCPECEPPPPPPAPNDQNYGTPRTRPPNETGEPGITMASRNYNWSTGLVSLPGRAGMDLGISLTYNSLVWTEENGQSSSTLIGAFPVRGSV